MGRKLFFASFAPIFLGAVFCCLLMQAAPSYAAQSAYKVKGDLRKVEKQLSTSKSTAKQLKNRAEKLGKLISENRQQLIGAAQNAQKKESELAELEAVLEGLSTQKQKYVDLMKEKHTNANMILARMIQLSMIPSAVVFAQPKPINDTIRSILVTRQMFPTLTKQAEGLRADIAVLVETQEEIQKQKERVSRKVARLDEDKNWLDYLIKRRQKTYTQVKTAREKKLERIAALAAKSQDFRQLLETLKQSRLTMNVQPAPKPKYAAKWNRKRSAPKSIKVARGGLILPVSGKVVRRYGQKDDVGGTARGMTIQARHSATVIAPYDGEVVYASKFRGYGNIIIIEHGDGYHTLLSGLGRIDTSVGQWLLSGEPVGVMGEKSKERLYVEFRRNGQPINMTPWIASRNKKVSG